MSMNLTTEQIKNYNKELKEHQERLANARSRKGVHEENLANECKLLSAELGIEVTPENIEQIYMEQMSKIEATVATGTEIMQRIKAEEQQIQVQNQLNQAQNMNQGQVQNQGQQFGGVPNQFMINQGQVVGNMGQNQMQQGMVNQQFGNTGMAQNQGNLGFMQGAIQGNAFASQQMQGQSVNQGQPAFDENIFGEIPPIFGK